MLPFFSITFWTCEVRSPSVPQRNAAAQPAASPASCCNFFKLFSGELMISAFYYDKEAGRNIVRIFNPTSENGTGILSGSCIPEKIEKIGYIRGGIAPGRETADPENLRLKPGEIASFIL